MGKKAHIAKSDKLTIQTVYRLYGLTEEEIALVEEGGWESSYMTKCSNPQKGPRSIKAALSKLGMNRNKGTFLGPNYLIFWQ